MLWIVLKQNYSPVYFPIDFQGYKIISIIFMMQPPLLFSNSLSLSLSRSVYISIYLSTYLYIYLSFPLTKCHKNREEVAKQDLKGL